MARWISAVSIAALPFLPLAGLAAPALTVPTNGISGCLVAPAGGGGIVEEDAGVTVMAPAAERREVELGATASTSASFPGLYLGSFEYSCALLGTGTLEYGSASGALSLDASSVPDALEPTKINPNDPFSNSGRARGEGLLRLQFDDSGTVVSDVLPAGMPVQLEFTFVLESIGVAVGPPLGPLLEASATYSVRAVDTAAPGAPVEAFLFGTQQVTRTLDTQVGRTVELQGILSLHVLALAGREFPGYPYYEEAQASIDAANSSHFTLQLPENVQFVAESGHDYTVPAPANALLLLTGALVLAAARPRRLDASRG